MRLGVVCLEVSGRHGGGRGGHALGFELAQLVLLCAEVAHENLPQLVLPRAGCGHPHIDDHAIDERRVDLAREMAKEVVQDILSGCAAFFSMELQYVGDGGV